MKILLVAPAAARVRVSPGHAPLNRRMFRFSVLPLTVVAALTPGEHEVEICDENVEALDFERPCDLVGVTFMTALAERAYEIAAEFRKRGVFTVAGGYHPSFLPDEAAAHFDAVVAGDAEGLWPRLLADVRNGTPRRVYRAAAPPDLAATPPPRRSLLAGKERHYATINAVQAGRGCVHACRYCSVSAFHNATYRARPLAQVLDEVRGVPRDFIFVDDNIIADPDYARRLFQGLAPLRKRWVSQCSIDIADDPGLLALASEAGCVGLFIGLESAHDGNLEAVGKGFNDSRRYQERIAAIRGAGIGVVAGIIVGMDHDGPRVFEETFRLLRRLRVDALQLNIMTPLPGTRLFDDFARQGRIADRSWSRYDFRHCVIRPAGMSAQQLQDGADWLYREFYRLDRILLRFVSGVATLGLAPAWLGLKLNLAYRADNVRERVRGRNPAAAPPARASAAALPATGSQRAA